jgi:hypothetical protein
MTDQASAPSASPLSVWQCMRFGDSDGVRAALAYYRERGWPVDDPLKSPEYLIYAFKHGWEAKVASSVVTPGPVRPSVELQKACKAFVAQGDRLRLDMRWQHSGDEESGQHDDDCLACLILGVLARMEAALAVLPPAESREAQENS